MSESATPKDRSLSVWPVPLSLATTYGISFDFSSWGYWDVSVHLVSPRKAMDSLYAEWVFNSSGFPHSEICGSKCMCHSPQLIAACHVLHRRLVPRHSPCALSNLTYSLNQHLCCSKAMVLLLYVSNPKHILMRRFFESLDSLFACANKLVLQIARPFKKFSFVFSFVLLLVFLCSFQGTMER